MKVYTSLVRFNFNQGRTLVVTLHKPSWFEWLFLFRRKKEVKYLGRKRTWYYFPDMRPIESEFLLNELERKERLHRILLGDKKHLKLPVPK